MRLSLLLAAMALAAPAMAEAPDPLCATLDKVIAAAGEAPRAFATLAPTLPLAADGAPLNVVGLRTSPFGQAKDCLLEYGGPTPRLTCTLANRDERTDPGGGQTWQDAAEVAREVKDCLAPQGWETGAYRVAGDGLERGTEWMSAPKGGGAQVRVREMTRIYGRDGEGRQYVASLEVYAPKP